MLYLYRVSTIQDFEFLYQLKSQKDAIMWSGFKTAPIKENFRSYFSDNILNNPSVYMFYLKDTIDDLPMGYIQFNIVGENKIEGRGINILKKYQGCGLLTEMTYLMCEEVKKIGYNSLFTWASEKNVLAINNLVDNGYIKTDEHEIRNMDAQNEQHVFYKWVKYL